MLLAAGLLLDRRRRIRSSGDRPPDHRARPGGTGYSSDERDFTVGRTVYLRSTKTRIGRIVAVDDDHEFPRELQEAAGRAVLLRHVDGPFDWLPVEGLSRVYVVR